MSESKCGPITKKDPDLIFPLLSPGMYWVSKALVEKYSPRLLKKLNAGEKIIAIEERKTP